MSIKKTIYILILAIVLGLPNPSMTWIVGGDPSYYISQIIHGRVERPLFLLTVTGSGTGSGTITSNIYGINCISTAGVESGVCSIQIPAGTTVVLTATATTGMFNGWIGGGCSGAGTCSVVISGNITADANFGIMPQSANLIGWYKVDEGSGSIVFNYAPPGPNRFPDLNVVTPGSGFWSTHSGFGYWDGLSTAVNRSFINTDPFVGNLITVMFFGRTEEVCGAPDYSFVPLQLRPGPAYYSEDFENFALTKIQFRAGVTSADITNINLSPCATYINRFYARAFRANAAGPEVEYVNFSSPTTGWTSNTYATAFGGGPVTAICLGYNCTGLPINWYKGVLGDVLIWNVWLTDAEINSILTLLGPRWGF